MSPKIWHWELAAYESGELTEGQVIGLFARLIRSGYISILQGHYGRAASRMVDAGVLDKKGNILIEGVLEYEGHEGRFEVEGVQYE